MPGRHQNARQGLPVRKAPGAFPLFADGRQPTVVTADAWAFLRHLARRRVPGLDAAKASSYLTQAREFYEAAATPRQGSRPLLYYYSFLNLAKAGLVIHGVKIPALARHGIWDPRVNQRVRLRFAGQRVEWTSRMANRSAMFPELLTLLSGAPTLRGTESLKGLIKQIPSIHRTYCRISRAPGHFLLISQVDVLQSGGQIWARFAIRRSDAGASRLFQRIARSRAFKKHLAQVHSPNSDQLWFETAAVPGHRKGVDNGIRRLAARLKGLGVTSILTRGGYRLYLSDIPPRLRLPHPAASFAVMFYLGSVTRYKPYDFDKIIDGPYGWAVKEFLATEPGQFLYTFASAVGGCAVVLPYAAPA